MNRFSLTAATLLAVAALAPAHAEKSDRIMVETMRARILAARDELGPNGEGRVELSEADARLRELSKALDNNEASDARASVNGIEALIAAARIRANASVAVLQAAPSGPASPSGGEAKLKTRKRINYSRPARHKCSCRMASR